MPDLRRSMKLSIVFGLIGAVLLPVLYEIYANISTTVGLFFVICWVFFAGVKFSGLTFKEALIGITCTIAYSGVFGFIFALAIHPAIMNFLIRRSVYFRLEPKAMLEFVAICFFLFIGMYLLWVIRFALCKVMAKFKSNREMAGSYIENAFNDEEDK
ncbi:hypothetical protein [Ruminococcus albus]|uniref:Uncharacterized protein n=1 Tax=Ruminococcus albus TaxID=1264 RepID=A0A1I1NI49_RUMAL|nr:hypothetical protein [Ruminococcus albus]SFC94423.1 hypothetical protein SAMN02910406_02722 [Ruminococcus albus]